MHRVRQIGGFALACVLVCAGGCARSRLTGTGLRPEGEIETGSTDAGTRDGAGRGGSAAAPGGSAGSGSGGQPAPPPPPMAGRAGGGTGSAGVGVIGGVGGGSTPPPPVAGSGPPPMGVDAGLPDGGYNPLNPHRCATEHPFVLSIDPGAVSGTVQGWLESAPEVVFDQWGLPRFAAGGPAPHTDPNADMGLWWSINELPVDGRPGALWFYAANSATEVAYVPVRRFAAIGDARMLEYSSWSVGPVKVGEIAVFHHIPTDRFLAMRPVHLYGTEDSDRREQCAAIDAQWVFAPPGTSDFSTIR